MAKKKRISEEKSVNEALDNAIEESEKASSTLQSLLQRVSEGTGFFKRQKEEQEQAIPQLSYEKRREIAEQYIMEDIPLSQRPKAVKARPSFADHVSITEKEPAIPQVAPKKAPLPPPITGKTSIYLKLSEFFEEFLSGYNERYNRWENSISHILAVLRKMRKITKKNTEDLTSTIEKLYTKIEENLNQFKIKRDQVEKVSGVDIETMSSEFKKVLGLLELQIKEYQLKRVVDEYIHHVSMFS
ncbi:MAG: hypothetical protein ACTSR8_16375 [Promethearchaeota archaeon]